MNYIVDYVVNNFVQNLTIRDFKAVFKSQF